MKSLVQRWRSFTSGRRVRKIVGVVVPVVLVFGVIGGAVANAVTAHPPVVRAVSPGLVGPAKLCPTGYAGPKTWITELHLGAAPTRECLAVKQSDWAEAVGVASQLPCSPGFSGPTRKVVGFYPTTWHRRPDYWAAVYGVTLAKCG